MEIEVYEEALKIAAEYYLEALKTIEKIIDKIDNKGTTTFSIEEQNLLKGTFIGTWLKEADVRLVTNRI